MKFLLRPVLTFILPHLSGDFTLLVVKKSNNELVYEIRNLLHKDPELTLIAFVLCVFILA